MLSFRLLGFATIFLCQLLVAGTGNAKEETAEQISETFRQTGSVGSRALVLKNGVVVADVMAGMADIERNQRVDDETIFHWASNTKMLTAIAVMQLRDRGLLRLEDPAVKFIPELKRIHNPFGSMEDVTIAHLLSHSSGLQSPSWPWGGDKPWHPHEPTEWSQLVAMMPYMELLFRPGAKFSYSNPAYNFLGRIVEVLTGDDIEVYIQKNIFMPLDMHTAFFDRTPWHLSGSRSNSYTLDDAKPVAMGRDFDTGATAANGGLNARFEDIEKLVRFLLGDLGQAGEQVLSRATLSEMTQPRTIARDDADLLVSFGLGFQIAEPRTGRARAKRFIGHDGSQWSYATSIFVSEDLEGAAIIALNTTGNAEQAKAFRRLQRELFEILASTHQNKLKPPK